MNNQDQIKKVITGIASIAQQESEPRLTDEQEKRLNNLELLNIASDLYVPIIQIVGSHNMGKLKAHLAQELELQRRELAVTENTSDGYHTFKELYEFRKLYNAALFNEWSRQGLYNVHKSKRHSTGELCFGAGWFIVVAELPTGQISNHYELKDWDLFRCREQALANVWDGHTAQDVAQRLLALLKET